MPCLQLQYRYYNFETPPGLDGTGKTVVPNVLMLLQTLADEITTNADIYCNPNWVTEQGKGSPAQPGDALFYSGADR